MSAIAGIVRFDGACVEADQVSRMTSAMAYRGPDGIGHWSGRGVTLGQCMLRTTPESAGEVQPWTCDLSGLALVMDGRVDNFDELRRDVIGRGGVLRNRCDAELVLRAYEIWGEDCVDRIVGEFVFALWDERRRTLFAARDAIGVRNFVYHSGRPGFLFASEVKGLLALEQVPRRLNESKVLDFLVVQHDRDDTVGTFYGDIHRLPAGHAMRVDGRGVATWRYWNPATLSPQRFASMDDCAEAYLDQLRTAVQSRLRSSHPVGALLSGGLDSSSIVGLARAEFRGQLKEPLRTFSLVGLNRAACPEWQAVQAMLKEGWLVDTIIDPGAVRRAGVRFMADIAQHDDPFITVNCFPTSLAFAAAAQTGCRVILEGMAGDLLSYGPDTSQQIIFRRWMLAKVPALIAAQHRHGVGSGLGSMAWRFLAEATPRPLRALYRSMRNHGGARTHLGPEIAGDNFRRMRPEVAARFAASKQPLLAAGIEAAAAAASDDQAFHARQFTSGLMSFAHEIEGDAACRMGLEERSPFSDRRLVEFAVRMPREAKLCDGWYKPMQRRALRGILPESVAWRQGIGEHPGWLFHDELLREIERSSPQLTDARFMVGALDRWVDAEQINLSLAEYRHNRDPALGYSVFSLAILAQWLHTHFGFT